MKEAQPERPQNCGTGFCSCIECVMEPAQQEPVAWKLVPIKPTDEMLKAMDECSTEGYDERLYAGHAASVYMAAVDVAPTPPQRKPLTDKEIDKMFEEAEIGIYIDDQYKQRHMEVFYFGVRDCEAAHGIKE